MLIRWIALALVLLGLSGITPARAENKPSAVVATVNGKPITEADLVIAKTLLAQELEALPEASRRDQLIEYLITFKLAVEEAHKQKIDAAPDYVAQLAFVNDKLLMDTLLQREAIKAVTPATVDAFYKDRVKDMKSEMEIRARHILLPTEEAAKAALAELKKGADFAELAKKLSKDPGSAQQGGDLGGYFTKDRMVPEFSEAAFKAPVGKLLPDPVKSPLGWHVIKVEDKRPQKAPELASVEPQIRAFLARKAQADYVSNLRKNAKVEKTDAPKAAAPTPDKTKSN